MKVIGADPYVLFDPNSKLYYCYATGSKKENNEFLIYKSHDLISWEFVGHALDSTKSWGKGWFWAPECYYNPNNHHYYLFYSALVRQELVEENFHDPHYEECCKIGVAVSTSPEGPFIDINDRPMDYYPFDEDYLDADAVYGKHIFEQNLDYSRLIHAPKGTYLSMIDVNLMFDENRIFMYYSRCCYRNCLYDPQLHKFVEESNIVGVELNTDWWFDPDAKAMPTIKKEYKKEVKSDDTVQRRDRFIKLINYHSQPQDWENGHVSDYEKSKGTKKNRRWSEGSTTFVQNINGKKVYCLTYSCNSFENALYGVGIAYSENPLGPYTKYEKNPIIHQIKEKSLYSTGHGTVIEMNHELYYFFHGRDDIKNNRCLYIGRLQINSEGDIQVSDIRQCQLVECLESSAINS